MRNDVATAQPVAVRSGLLVRSPTDGRLVLLPHRFIDHLLARVFAARLDALLARGHSAEESRLLAARATLLVSLRHRTRLADALTDLLARARRTDALVDTRVPVARAAVLAAGAQITRLAAALHRPASADAGDIARVHALLTNGESAIYTGDDLDTEVAGLADALEQGTS